MHLTLLNINKYSGSLFLLVLTKLYMAHLDVYIIPCGEIKKGSK